MHLTNKTAIVTGSTSGIGLGTAKALAAHGANIVLNGFGDAALIEQLKKEVTEAGAPKVMHVGADMRKQSEINDMVAKAEQEFGSVDILVNNAGIQFVSELEKFPKDKWDDIIAINLTAPFHLTKAVLPGMQKRKWGRIVNIASVQGLIGSINKSAYVASKHGIIGLTKVTALENATRGITCNAVCPGYVLTPLVQKQLDDRAKEKGLTPEQAVESLLGEKQPMMQFVRVENIANMVAYMCSPAADRMTGASVPVDGGWTAQ